MASFYTITCSYYPGYNLVQRGAHLMLEASDVNNPFQIWYKDDTWRFITDGNGNPAFAFINNGSMAALKADSSSPTKVSFYNDYKRCEDTSLTTLWTTSTTLSGVIYSIVLTGTLRLGLGPSSSIPTTGEGVSVILSTATSTTTNANTWTFNAYVPLRYYKIQCNWYNQLLVVKSPNTNVTFTNSSGTFNDKLTVVGVHAANANNDVEVWYKVPARGSLEDSNTSFIIISRSNGKALRGSKKAGDIVIVKEYDPLDNDFVWSEDRTLSSSNTTLAIKLANPSTTLHWYLPPDAEYQNAAYYHPLTLRTAPSASSQYQWSFLTYTTS